MEIISLIAILVGPILAIIVTRIIDNYRDSRDRKIAIFKTLMRTRRTPISSEHVGALNLIELEFSNEREVIAKWQDLYKHFAAQHSPRNDEQINDAQSYEEKNIRREKFNQRLSKERQALLAKLLHAMGKVLKYKIEQLEIFEGGYTPQGWEDVESAQTIARQYITDLYLGKKVLPVTIIPIPESE